MEAKPRDYRGEAISLLFDGARCIHAQVCIKEFTRLDGEQLRVTRAAPCCREESKNKPFRDNTRFAVASEGR